MQILQGIPEAGLKLVDYGVLGILAILLISAIVYMEKQRTKQGNDLNTRVTHLEVKLEEKQKEHENFLNGAYREATEVVRACVDLLNEVKDILKQKN